jgi:hypothetical protein
MRTRQRNRLRMYQTLSEWLAKNEEVMQDAPAFAPLIKDFDLIVEKIVDAAEHQGTVTIGHTPRKVKATEQLISALIPVRAMLRALALRTGREELAILSGASEWGLRSLRDAELAERASLLQRHALALKTELASYGVTEKQIDDLGAAVISYTKSLDDREIGLVERKEARVSLEALFAQADDLLTTQLDTMVEFYRDANPVFYEGYFVARSIRNTGVRHAQLAPLPTQTPAPSAQ